MSLLMLIKRFNEICNGDRIILNVIFVVGFVISLDTFWHYQSKRNETFSNRFCHVAFPASKLRKSESWSRKFRKIRIHLLNKLEKLTSTKAIKASDNSTSGFPLTTFIRSPTPEQSKYLKNYVWKYGILYVLYI